MARANKKKLSDIANESDAKYDKVKLQAAAITETFTEGDDGPGHNEEALVYLKLKLEDIVDDINVLATDVVDANTSKTGITSTQASAITANSTIENKTEGTISFGTPDKRTGAMTITVKVGENKFTYTLAAN